MLSSKSKSRLRKSILLRHLKGDYGVSLLKAGLTAADKVDNVMLWSKINLDNIFEYILSLRDYNNEYIGKYKERSKGVFLSIIGVLFHAHIS